ncbi:MAG: 4-hydroxy-tetrahydrodipicolinate reductase [Candidatus Porifericomitaceae bacterium WSBS_2022_MAG_OTU9]
MSKPLLVVVNGAAGRMGRAVVSACHGDLGERMRIVGALESPSSPHVGEQVGRLVGIPELSTLISSDVGIIGELKPDVVIDFSVPDSTLELLNICVATGTPVVTGTTGWEPRHDERIQQAGKSLPLVVAANMSVGVNLCLALLEQAAVVLADADIEVLEMHHNGKSDTPSGTALAMGKTICAALGWDHGAVAEYGRSAGVRKEGGIGYASLRIADSVGEHTVMFGTLGERIEITHKALNRDIFARGALRAAAWLVAKPAGVYGMREVLGLPTRLQG